LDYFGLHQEYFQFILDPIVKGGLKLHRCTWDLYSLKGLYLTLKKIHDNHSTLSTIAALISRCIEKYGCDSRALFHQAGLDPEMIKDPDARYPVKRMQHLWKLAADETGQEAFGILLAKEFQPGALQGLGFAWLASDTLQDALNRLVRYTNLISTAVSWTLHYKKNKCYLALKPTTDYLDALDPASIDAGLAMAVQMCRLSAIPDMVPLQVDLSRKAPRDIKTYEDFFRASINFSSNQNALLFSQKQIEQSLMFANPQLARASDQIVKSYLDNFEQGSIVQQVRIQIIECLPSGRPSQERIARSLCMSLRSMQRELQKEQINYKSVLEDTRKTLANHYIKSSSRSIGEIAYLLGFSEPSSFARAFKGWTGHTPGEERP
jgi:AraC-like DNA-binding protein